MTEQTQTETILGPPITHAQSIPRFRQRGLAADLKTKQPGRFSSILRAQPGGNLAGGWARKT